MLKIFGRLFAIVALLSTVAMATGCGDDTNENKDAAQDQKTDGTQG